MSLIKVNTIQNANGTTALVIAANGQLSSVNTAVANVTTLNATSGVLATQNGMTGIAKAWVNFGVSGGVVTVNNSFNVSSVTRSSTGRYSMTYTTAQANANYVLYASGAPSSDQIIYAISPFGATYGTNNTTTAFFTYINDSGPALVDPLTGFAAVFAS